MANRRRNRMHNNLNHHRYNLITTSDRHDFEAIAQYLQHREIPMSNVDDQRLTLTIPSNRVNDVHKEISRLNGVVSEVENHEYDDAEYNSQYN